MPHYGASCPISYFGRTSPSNPPMKTTPTPPAAESALTLCLRQNPASSLTGGPIVEDDTGGFFCECSLLTDAERIVTAVNAHAAAQQRIAELQGALERIIILYVSGYLKPTADGHARFDHALKQARLALRHPSLESK